jgi:hypothetical protein
VEKQLTFGGWLRKQNAIPRLEGWHMYVLGQVNKEHEIRALRDWCKTSMMGRYKIKPERIVSPILAKKMCIACLVWIETDDDALLFKLRWSDYE